MERIKHTISIPIEGGETANVNVDTSKEEISKLITKIIEDENFRVQINKDPEKIFKDVGISLDQATIEKLKRSSIKEMLEKSLPPEEAIPGQTQGIGVAVVVVGVIIGVIAPSGPVE